MRAIAIVQARMRSTRLPGKALKPILGRPMLWHVVDRIRCSPLIRDVVVATSDHAADEPLRRFCVEADIPLFAGSELDVLDRFYRAAIESRGDPLIRVTADCPFVDPVVLNRLVTLYANGGYDHVGVATGAGALFMKEGRFPDGMDAECFSFATLKRAWQEAGDPGDREHVTPYIWRVPGRFRLGVLSAEQDFSSLRWTVDNESDFDMVSRIYAALYREDRPFLMRDILGFVASHPQIAAGNRAFIGREHYQEVWNPAPPQAALQEMT